MVTIFSGQTTNTTTEGFLLSDVGTARATTIYCWGTFDGASVELEVSPDGVEWFDITGDATGTFTAKEGRTVQVSAYMVRGVVSSAGASTSVNMVVM